MKIINRILDKLLKDESNTFSVLDLGTRYVKCFFIKDSCIERIFIERNTGSSVKAALKLLTDNNLLNKPVKVSLKGLSTLTRYIPFPKLDKEKLRESVGYELSKYIPFSKDEVYFDTSIVNDNYSKQEFLILLAVAKKDFVDLILEELKDAKAIIDTVSLSSIDLINLFFYLHKPLANTAIIDFGFSSTIVNIVRKNTPYLSREIKTPAKDLIEKISRARNIKFDDAEKEFIRLSSKGVVEIGEQFFSGILSEVKNSFDYFEMNAGEGINKIFISGGLSNINGVKEITSEFLGIEVKVWDIMPFKHPSVSYPDIMLAVGLGLSL